MEREQFFQREKQAESIVDLSKIKMIYISDKEIDVYYAQEIEKVENRENWIAKNEQRINKESIKRGFEEGVIPEESIEAVWQYVYNRKLGEVEKVKKLRDKIELELSGTLQDVSLRLAKFIPIWKPEKINIEFTINERANFCNDQTGKKVTIDLVRLTACDDVEEKLINGLVHELVHCWMKEGKDEKEMSDKDNALFGIAGEGLTTYIAKDDLQSHHGKNDAEYAEYKKESMALFQELLTESESADLEKYFEEFENMGRFYVVGNEIVKTVVEKIGIEKFRELLLKIRKNHMILFEEYEKR